MTQCAILMQYGPDSIIPCRITPAGTMICPISISVAPGSACHFAAGSYVLMVIATDSNVRTAVAADKSGL
jgi:hypothetical protein